jgi:hypothetical protein
MVRRTIHSSLGVFSSAMFPLAFFVGIENDGPKPRFAGANVARSAPPATRIDGVYCEPRPIDVNKILQSFNTTIAMAEQFRRFATSDVQMPGQFSEKSTFG